MKLTTAIRRAFDRSGHLSSSVSRAGRRSTALGALLLAASTATVLATANTPPEITSATVTPSTFKEGDTVTLSATFADADAADLHTVRIRWHDGSRTEQIQLPAGQTSFQVKHTYRDDQSKYSGQNNVRFTVYDRQTPPGSPNDNGSGVGQDLESVPTTASNVAPSFVDRGITVTKKGGGNVVIEGDIVEPGSADQLQLTARWSDPTAPGATACNVSAGEGTSRRFSCEHAYRPNLQAKTYQVGLVVKDDDGGLDQYQTTVRLP
jgi:hypothetical protein